jgi:hypothetical protein
MNWLSLVGTIVASATALTIAFVGWKRQDRREQQDRIDAVKEKQVQLLADLLELSIAGGGVPEGRDAAKAKAILLRLPGHLATVLRPALGLKHTMHVPVDVATAARMKPTEPHDASHKWWIFNRASALTNREFRARREWIEAEILYDIAGLMGEDQDVILAALKKDVRDMDTAIRVHIQQQQAATENGTLQ